MKHCRICLLPLIILFAGCPADTHQSNPPASTSSSDHSDSHQHSHDHSAEGPHGGHILALGEEAFHLEWLHDDSGKLTFFLLDDHAKADVTTSASKITIKTTVKEELTSTDIPAIDQAADSHHQFQIVDPVLLQQLELVGHGVTAQVIILIDDVPFTGEFEHMEHDGQPFREGGWAYHPIHAISRRLTTDFSLRSSEPSQPRGGRHKGAAVEMCVSPLGSRRRPVANAAAPGADENGTPFPYTDHRKCSFSTGFIRVLLMQPASAESSFCQWFCMVLGMRVRIRGKIHGNTMV